MTKEEFFEQMKHTRFDARTVKALQQVFGENSVGMVEGPTRTILLMDFTKLEKITLFDFKKQYVQAIVKING